MSTNIINKDTSPDIDVGAVLGSDVGASAGTDVGSSKVMSFSINNGVAVALILSSQMVLTPVAVGLISIALVVGSLTILDSSGLDSIIQRFTYL